MINTNVRIVPEEVIKNCADEVSDQPQNNFLFLLEKHKVFKDAGLTPVFLTENMVDVFVSTVEKLRKELHWGLHEILY